MDDVRRRPIGVFDSGVGGVSVLRDMVRLLPRERFLYYGDNRNAPYGVLDEDAIRTLALLAADFLIQKGIKALVVACNTATSAAVEDLRARLSIPVVGMEPALKPASQLRAGGKILVLATPATLRQRKFQALYALYGAGALVLPCEGLMEFVERDEADGGAVDAYLERIFAPVRGERLDAAVLGCTHYVFLKRAIARALPGVALVDGNIGTARRLHEVLRRADLLDDFGTGGVTFYTSGDASVHIPLMERLFLSD